MELILFIFSVMFAAACAYQHITYGESKDKLIQSDNYPKPYPTHSNVTWTFHVASGQWGVVVKDFDLDEWRAASLEGEDWLEIDDKSSRKPVRYSAYNPPVVSYISRGPTLVIKFESDGFTQKETRGFQLQVLYGATERELELKIHEETTRKDEKDKDDNPSPILIIIGAILIILLIGVIVIGFIFVRRGRNQGQGLNAFGVRRNSGISHHRRQRGIDGGAGEAASPDQPDRPAHHATWVARAELNTSMKASGSSTHPNLYTESAGTSTSLTHQNSLRRKESTSSIKKRHHTENSRLNGAAAYPSESREAKSPLKDMCSPKFLASSTTNRASQNLYLTPLPCPKSPSVEVMDDGASHTSVLSDDYADTVDSLKPSRQAMVSEAERLQKPIQSPGSISHKNLLTPSPPPPYTKQSSESSKCYENVTFPPTPTPPPTPSMSVIHKHQSTSQTNIYINAPGVSPCGSSSKITIDTSANQSVSFTTAQSTEPVVETNKAKLPKTRRDKELKISKCEKTEFKRSKSQDDSLLQSPPCSTASVEIIDGYAYVIPFGKQDEVKQISGNDSISIMDEPDVSSSNTTLQSSVTATIKSPVSMRKISEQSPYANVHEDFPQ